MLLAQHSLGALLLPRHAWHAGCMHGCGLAALPCAAPWHCGRPLDRVVLHRMAMVCTHVLSMVTLAAFLYATPMVACVLQHMPNEGLLHLLMQHTHGLLGQCYGAGAEALR